MDKVLKNHISQLLKIKIVDVKPVSGGDISKAYLLETDAERFFCKINYGSHAHEMFLAEKAGLEAIEITQTISTPKALLCEKLEKGGCLLMEYIEPKSPTEKDFETFGHRLAELHKIPKNDFGWDRDNFIGSLPQSNKKHTDWASFYVNERLRPQLEMAVGKGLLSTLESPSNQNMSSVCKTLFQNVKPSLLHGDLWGGNYLISFGGTPYLIDPAVYCGHCEVDIAMSRLFGGFHNRFYSAYEEHFPKTDGHKERQELYQLYYLLVHLNLFGRSYYGSVKAILDRCF